MLKLWFDTETTGLNPSKHGILTAYFAVCDDKLNIVDELYLKVKAFDMNVIEVTPGAMAVNQINLADHLKDPETITYGEAKSVLIDFFKRNGAKNTKSRLQPCGHNIQFDIDMLCSWIFDGKEEWEKYVHYRKLDTSGVCSFLKDVGFFPNDLGNLSSLVEYFKIPLKEAHHAKNDVLMNIEVYRAVVGMMKSLKTNAIVSADSSLLSIIER